MRQTAKSKLKPVDFRFEDRELRGLEQNPKTKSRWAKLAREGKRVMQFLEQFLERGKYVAVAVDGKVHIYRQARGSERVKRESDPKTRVHTTNLGHPPS